MMHKKVYVDFARMIRSQRHKAVLLTPEESVQAEVIVQARNKVIDSIAEGLADIFGNDNANFHRGKFMQACEIDTESK